MRRHIVMIASGSGTADPRIAKEATALLGAGYAITVLAWDRAGTSPGVADYDGWRVESLGPRARHGAGLANIGHYRRFWAEAAARVAELRPDVVHCHNLDTAPAALRALRVLPAQTRLVLDFWEMYRHSQALPQRGVKGVVARAAARVLERRSIPRADLVITVGQGQVYYYEALKARRIVVVENAPDLARYPVVTRDAEEFVVSFIGQKRWLPPLLNLMRAVQADARLHALLVGGGPGEHDLAAAASGFERIEVHGRVDAAEIPALYARCDAVYACYDPSLLNWRTAYPVKDMEAMACGLPLIVNRGTFAAEYVETHGLGYAVDDEDVDDIARALILLADDRSAAREMGMRGRVIAERELNWHAAAARLVDAYDALFAASGVPLE